MDLSGADRERIIEPLDRDSGIWRYWVCGIAVLIVAGLYCYVYKADIIKLYAFSIVHKDHDFSKLVEKYHMPTIPSPLITSDMYEHLLKLEGNYCDWDAMQAVGEGLKTEGQGRLSAEIYLTFPQGCQADGFADRSAAIEFDNVAEFQSSLNIYKRLVSDHPDYDQDWYHKGQVEQKLRLTNDAINSYAQLMALTSDHKGLGEWVFDEWRDIYVSAKRYCEAMQPILTYISLDAESRDTPRNQQILADLAKKGNCTRYATGVESWPVHDHNVITVKATVNGIAGRFFIDTGATYLSVNDSFARRAGMERHGTVRLNTANGATDSPLSSARTVQVGNLHAEDVSVSIMTTPMSNVDGLLGRSFLSRFNMNVSDRKLTLTAR